MVRTECSATWKLSAPRLCSSAPRGMDIPSAHAACLCLGFQPYTQALLPCLSSPVPQAGPAVSFCWVQVSVPGSQDTRTSPGSLVPLPELITWLHHPDPSRAWFSPAHCPHSSPLRLPWLLCKGPWSESKLNSWAHTGPSSALLLPGQQNRPCSGQCGQQGTMV